MIAQHPTDAAHATAEQFAWQCRRLFTQSTDLTDAVEFSHGVEGVGLQVTPWVECMGHRSGYLSREPRKFLGEVAAKLAGSSLGCWHYEAGEVLDFADFMLDHEFGSDVEKWRAWRQGGAGAVAQMHGGLHRIQVANN